MEVIYNVTVSINPTVEEAWVDYMCSTHIPEVIATGCFMECRMSKMNNEEDGACTYAMTYVAFGQEDLDRYQKNFAADLQKDHKDKFEGQFAAFRTTLNVIQFFSHER